VAFSLKVVIFTAILIPHSLTIYSLTIPYIRLTHCHDWPAGDLG
jgi:hypothetical protein